MKKLGIVALESSHVDQFCRILNRPEADDHLEGARIVALCPQDNPQERVDELCSTYGIETVVDSPDEMAPLVDCAMMLGRDGAGHCEQALPFLQAGTPCFVDKPFAHSMEDAEMMVRTAREHGAAITTSSALRWAAEFADAAEEIAAVGDLVHASLIGPGELFFYGIHQTDLLMSLMGPGVEAVSNTQEETFDLVTVSYGDGRSASLQVLRGAKAWFRAHLVGTDGDLTIEPRTDCYRRQLQSLLPMLETGEEPVPETQMLESVRILVAADRSAKQSGRAVRLAEVYAWERPF